LVVKAGHVIAACEDDPANAFLARSLEDVERCADIRLQQMMELVLVGDGREMDHGVSPLHGTPRCVEVGQIKKERLLTIRHGMEFLHVDETKSAEAPAPGCSEDRTDPTSGARQHYDVWIGHAGDPNGRWVDLGALSKAERRTRGASRDGELDQ
jgi:hypothetical protein